MEHPEITRNTQNNQSYRNSTHNAMNLSPTPMDTDLPSTTPTSGSLSPLPDLMDDADGTGSLDPLSLDAVIAIDSSLVEIGGGVEAWLIPSWTTLQADSRVSGPAFELGGYRWCVTLEALP